MILLAVSLGGRILVEQPGGTAFAYFPRWEWLLQILNVALLKQALSLFGSCLGICVAAYVIATMSFAAASG